MLTASSEPSPTSGSSSLLKLIGFLVLLAGGFASAYFLGFFEPGFAESLSQRLQGLGPWAPFCFFALKVITVIFALPSAPVTMAGGLLFGLFEGLLINIVAATTGAAVTFALSRIVGREEVEKRLGGRLQALDQKLANHGLWAMLFVRLVPLFPFNAINYGAGLTKISFRAYFIGTLIGIIPGATVFTMLGVAAQEASLLKASVALGALGLLSLLPVWFRPHRSIPDTDGTVDPNSQ